MAAVLHSPAFVSTAEYVTQLSPDDWRVTGSGVSLASVILEFREGMTPESILKDFPSLTLEQIYGAITFALRNPALVQDYLSNQKRREDATRRECEDRNQELRQRIIRRSRQSRGGSSAPRRVLLSGR